MLKLKRDKKLWAKLTRVRFEPAYLDFGQVHIGEELVKRVTIFNLNQDETLHINVRQKIHFSDGI